MEIIGELLKNNKAELEWFEQGFIYKDFDAYTYKEEKICYIPESGLEKDNTIATSYTFKDYINIAEEYFKENGFEGDPWVLADYLFEFSTWQHPETLVEEWDVMKEFDNYPIEHGIYAEKIKNNSNK